MNESNRRAFLRDTGRAGLGAAALAALATSNPVRAASAGNKLTLAVVGLRGRGTPLAEGFAERPDCQVAYLADVDTAIAGSKVKQIESIQGGAPAIVQDFRRALDDKAVDAIVVATPDHWHALATVWGCQAGKHVYVEKPASHTPWEGRKMVEAARKHKRVVQVGLQNRSAPYNMAAKEYIDSGKLGTIHLCRVFNQKHHPNFPAVPDGKPAASFDWDMFNGPAPEAHYNANYQNHWHCFWRYSGGDIINDGVHQMDLARWLIGKEYPRSVFCTGGRFAEPGADETPDTQVAVYDFGDLTMTFEMTLYCPAMIKSDMVLRNSDQYPWWLQNGTRIEIYGTKGLMIAGRHGDGWQVFVKQKDRQPVIAAEGNGNFPDPEHKQNFCDAIRGTAEPSADIEKGHRSTLLCQYADISYRLGGEKLTIDPQTETCIANSRACEMLKREYRAPWILSDVV